MLQHGLITRRQALEHGYSSSQVDRRLASGRWEGVFRGVFRLEGTRRSFQQQVMAACLAVGPEAVASHRSAGALYEFRGVVRRLEITVPYQRSVAIEGIVVHRSKYLPDQDRSALLGIPVTSPARTVVDLASVYDKGRLADNILDPALAQRLLRRSDLERANTEGGRVRSTVVAALLAERPAGRRPVGSDIEKALFRGLTAAGMPLPVPQYRVILADGSERFVDWAFLFESLKAGVGTVKLAVEVLSYRWHADLASWAADIDRTADLRHVGWEVEPTTSHRILHQLPEVVDQIGRALVRLGHPGLPGSQTR